ncbi:MAG: FAD-dependent oxidoreductase [Slackia sp.]|nr:FAD-dependent oxidoreductase [Slackia sp.]
MNVKELYDAVIVGGGPAGLTAALYLARARMRVLVLEKDRFGGQIAITSEVVNYPGVAQTSGAHLTETMRAQAESFGAEFLAAEAVGIDMDGDVKTVRTNKGDFKAFAILLATGAHPRRAGIAGEDEFAGRGVGYCATCDGEFFQGKEVFVIGGGFSAAEEGVFLTKYAKHVTILVRGDDFTCAPDAAAAARSHEKVTVLTNTQAVAIEGDTMMRSLTYRNTETGEETTYHAPEGDTFGLFVFAGYEPATELVRDVLKLDERGYVMADAGRRTEAAGLFAAGDVCAKELRQVVTATGDGAAAAASIEHYAAAMQRKTGLVPVQPALERDEKPATPAAEASSPAPSDASGATEGLFDEAMLAQLQAVFARMAQPVILELHQNGSAASQELAAYAHELASLGDRVRVEQGDSSDEAAPFVRVLRADGTDSGLAFHGVPGGHEFTSFVLGLYNVAGPGQPLDDATRARIAAVEGPLDVKVLVSLSCTMCPETVVAAQRIAAENNAVRAEVYDIAHSPELKERYNVMSVPCVVVGDGEQVLFGRKNIEQLLDALA